MIANKRYTVYFSVQTKAAKALKKAAYKKNISVSKLVRKNLEKIGLIPKEEEVEI